MKFTKPITTVRLGTGTYLNDDERNTLRKVILHHTVTSGDIDLDSLAFACLDCYSIGVCENREARDFFVLHFDPTCCGLENICLFLSNENSYYRVPPEAIPPMFYLRSVK